MGCLYSSLERPEGDYDGDGVDNDDDDNIGNVVDDGDGADNGDGVDNGDDVDTAECVCNGDAYLIFVIFYTGKIFGE